MSPRPFRWALLWTALVPAALSAQAKQDSVLLRGRVVEEHSGTPIVHASLTLLDRQGRIVSRTESGDAGEFTVVVRDQFGVAIQASRFGYTPATTPFLWFDDHLFFEVEVRLDPDAVLLAPLEIMAMRRDSSAVLSAFYHRVRRGMGWYFTRDEIEAMRPGRVTDILTHVPGVHLASSGAGLRRIVQIGRTAASPSGCPAQVYIDGMHLNARTGPPDTRVVAIDDYVSPGSVEGIEVYRGLSTVPAEFLNEDAKCGVVVVWTRRGRG